MQLELSQRFPQLPQPATYDAVEELTTRLRDDLTIALAALDDLRAQEIAALEARLTQLRAHARPPRPAETPAPSLDYACPQCGKAFASDHARTVHVGRAHKAPASLTPPDDQTIAAYAEAALTRVVEVAPAPAPEPEPAWACAACHSDTNERSLSDPTRCKPCVKAANDRAAARGVFICGSCGSKAHAPSISDPDICTRCDAAQRHQRRPAA